MRRWTKPIAAALLALAAAGADAKPDAAAVRADLESLVRWFERPEIEALHEPSPTFLVDRLAAAGEALLRPELDKAQYGDGGRRFRAQLFAIVGALYDFAPPPSDRWVDCRIDVVEGAAAPVCTHRENADDSCDESMPINTLVHDHKLRPKPLVVQPLRVFAAMDKAQLPLLDARRSIAFGVALGEACRRADVNAAELLRRAKSAPSDVVLLHALGGLASPTAAAFLAERVAAEATSATDKGAPGDALAAACHALRRIDEKRFDAAFAALPSAAQDAVLASIEIDSAAVRFWQAVRAAPDDAARDEVLRRAFTVLAAGPRLRNAGAEAGVRLFDAAAGRGAPLVEAMKKACSATLGLSDEDPPFLPFEIRMKFDERPESTPRRKVGRCLGAWPSLAAELRAYVAALDAGDITLVDPAPAGLFDPAPSWKDAGAHGPLVSGVAPPVGREDDVWPTDASFELKGEPTDEGWRLTLTNRVSPAAAVPVSLFAFSRLTFTENFVPPTATKASYRTLEIELGPKAATTVVASKLRVLAAGESVSWTVAVPAEFRACDHVRVEFRSGDRVAGTPAAPVLTGWWATWVR